MDSNNMNQQPAPQYQAPVQPAYTPENQEKICTVGDWFLTILLTCIPCVGIIMLFVWAFGGCPSKSKSNWAKAQLIWMVIGIIIGIIFYITMGAVLIDQLGGLPAM